MTHIVVVVPGIMGSELKLGEEVIWPGPLLSLIGSYKKMDQLLNPDLVATDLIREFSISEQYRGLIDDLERCGFTEQGPNPTLVVCPYDWRKDNRLAAEILAECIEGVAKSHGETTSEVTLIGHSMGGLIARYYLESGDFNRRPGYTSVHRLITMGTPHRGGPLALSAALGMEKRLFLSAAQVCQLASDSRYPSLYQLLPPRGEPFAWIADKGQRYSTEDIYDRTVAKGLGLNLDNLGAAVAFHSKLNLSSRPRIADTPIRYFFFAGSHHTTISAVTLLSVGTQYRIRNVEIDNSGDGTVPSWSGMMTGVQCQVVGGEHSTLYRNSELRRTLGILLGKEGYLAAAAERVEVSLRERVVNAAAAVHVTLGFGSGVDVLSGRLDVQQAQLDTEGDIAGFSSPVSSYPISYRGLNAEKLSVILPAPQRPGVYRVVYYPDGRNVPAGADELFVQGGT